MAPYCHPHSNPCTDSCWGSCIQLLHDISPDTSTAGVIQQPLCHMSYGHHMKTKLACILPKIRSANFTTQTAMDEESHQTHDIKEIEVVPLQPQLTLWLHFS